MTLQTAIHLLHHYPHLWQSVFAHHPKRTHHMAVVIHGYPQKMRHLLSTTHYRRWLISYVASHHRLPGIDLLLGA